MSDPGDEQTRCASHGHDTSCPGKAAGHNATDQPEMMSESPLTADADTGLASVTENAEAVTVMLATFVVPRFVVPLRSETDAAFPVHAALTAVKLTAVT